MAEQVPIAPLGYGNEYLDTLIAGYRWGAGPIKFAFAEGTIRSDSGVTGTGGHWDPYEKQAFYNAIYELEAVCNIDFQETGDYDRADILWYNVPNSLVDTDDDDVITEAHHEYPDAIRPQIYGFFSNDRPFWTQLTAGEIGFRTIL